MQPNAACCCREFLRRSLFAIRRLHRQKALGHCPLPPSNAAAGAATTAALFAIVANYQAHLPSLRPFGRTSCDKDRLQTPPPPPLRVVPARGDTVQIVAAAGGGVDVYLNLSAPFAALSGPDEVHMSEERQLRECLMRGGSLV